MNGHIQLKDIDGNVIKKADDIHPEVFIREILKDYKSPKIEGLPVHLQAGLSVTSHMII